MAPPAKRQKRLVHSSDDDLSSSHDRTTVVENVKPKRADRAGKQTPDKPASNRSNASPKTTKTTKRRTSAASTPNSSPEKKKTKIGIEDTVKSKSLHSFFSKASDEQRWQKRKTPVQPEGLDEDVEDIDDSSDDTGTGSSNVARRASHKSSDKTRLSGSSNGGASRTLTASKSNDSASMTIGAQRFSISSFKHSSSASFSGIIPTNVDRRPWADQFGPENLDELAVHRKKVMDVKAWLVDALSHPQRRHLLVLKGPAGSGKTTTLHLLCTAVGVQPLEWRNSTTSDGPRSASFSSHFDDFLNRSGQFGSLDFCTASDDIKHGSFKDGEAARRVLVVDEFPTTFTRSAAALQSFRRSLLRFLSTSSTKGSTLFQSPKPGLDESPPLVMIVSETLLSSASASADSFTAHRLLGPEISNHPCTHIIEFNPVAPTFISKALDVVVKKEARVSKRRRIPGPAIMKRLSEMGDVRNAVNSLEFLCLRGDDTGNWGGRVASKPKKGEKSGVALTDLERESLELVTQRESTLGMFHAVGKVVYNKRDPPEEPLQSPIPPPGHLSQLHRANVSQVLVDDLMNETGTDISTFISSLHENYVLSCTGPLFVEHLELSAHYLSESDLLDTDSRRSITAYRAGVGSARPTISTGATDIIRQSELNFDVAVRGLLFALPSPVARATHPTGRKGDSHKMFFPAALRLWKKTEEIEGVLSIWRDKLEQGPSELTSIPAELSKRNASLDSARGVSSWKQSTAHAPSQSAPRDGEAEPHRFLISRSDILSDYLPYLNKILQSQNGAARGRADLNIVTQFEGIGASLEEEEADDAEDAMTVAPTADDHGRGRTKILPDQGKSAMRALEEKLEADAARSGVEKLYISDDDIEDE